MDYYQKSKSDDWDGPRGIVCDRLGIRGPETHPGAPPRPYTDPPPTHFDSHHDGFTVTFTFTAGASLARGLTLCLVDVEGTAIVTGPTGISTCNPCTLFLGLMMMMMRMANESIIHPTEPNEFLKNSLADTSFHPHQNTLSNHETRYMLA
eukprot:scaffold16700_cov47-Attheya_sp.AAC.1